MINSNGQDSRLYKFYMPVVIPWHNTKMHCMYNVPIVIKQELASMYLIENMIEDYELGNLQTI